MGMMTRPDVLIPFLALHDLAERAHPVRRQEQTAASGDQAAWEMNLMTALNELKRDVPPPSPEKMAEGKRRLLQLAAERRRQRLIDLSA